MNNKSMVIKFAQELLEREKDNNYNFEVTPKTIEEKVNQVLGIFSLEISDDDFVFITNELTRRLSYWVDKDSFIQDGNDHIEWLSIERKQNRRYWQRYREYLEPKLPWSAIDALDESTDNILGMLEDPTREGSWDRRGMVVGHVQSGKTGNYTSLINKAADAGYKIIIVLAGLHNNLRAQTQMRLDEGFLGFETNPDRSAQHRVIGVGKIDKDPSIRPNYATNRQEKGDFNKSQSEMGITPEQRPWLFVVKKNKSVLEGLLEWIQVNVAHNNTYDRQNKSLKKVQQLPLLLIDDEADNASIDTNELQNGPVNDEHSPTAINSCIRQILNSFSKKAYVAYTATPFANIFIHDKAETKLEGRDLFPESFIVNLSAPSNYVGPSKMFSEDSEFDAIREISDHEEWMPTSPKSNHVPIHPSDEGFPNSLKEAIHSYLLATTIRYLRGHKDEHSSMLVHVARFTYIQNIVHSSIDSYIRKINQLLSWQTGGHKRILTELHSLWTRDFCNTNDFHSLEWKEIETTLITLISEIKVKQINGTAKDVLDYSDSSLPQRVIAIGGDKLARGLTLEGLCTSYFLRCSRMYDTLMQMGRWFGYREGYADLCRLYTTADLAEWFEHISKAATELREEFEQMATSGQKPIHYGLKVRSHPTLLVTSRLKMRNSEQLRLSFSGTISETVTFHSTREHIEKNFLAFKNLTSSLGPSSPVVVFNGEKFQESKNRVMWRDIPAKKVIDFLEAYVTHEESVKVNSALMSNFIREMVNAHDELKLWDVAVIGGKSEKKLDFDDDIRLVERTLKSYENRVSIGRLLSNRDEFIGLSETDYQAAMEHTLAHWEKTKSEHNRKQPTEPAGIQVRKVKGATKQAKGLLLLYPLYPDPDHLPSIEQAIIGIGVSFPSSSSNTQGTEYYVNNVFQDYENA
ncbi:Z1 domain-containing protein [Vibrio vulnificus]